MDMRFGMLGVYRAESLKTAASELANYNLNPVAIKWSNGTNVTVGQQTIM
jgi:hypothetical protein